MLLGCEDPDAVRQMAKRLKMAGFDYTQSASNSAGMSAASIPAKMNNLRSQEGLHGVYVQYQNILRQLDACASMATDLANRLGGSLPDNTNESACNGPRSSGVLGQLEDIVGSLRSRLADVEIAHARLDKMIGE